MCLISLFQPHKNAFPILIIAHYMNVKKCTYMQLRVWENKKKLKIEKERSEIIDNTKTEPVCGLSAA